MSRIFDHTCGLSQWHDVVDDEVDVVPLMKTAGVVENSGHCTYSIVLRCFLNCLSLLHLVFHLFQSNTRYFANQIERLTYNYEFRTFVYIYIYIYIW